MKPGKRLARGRARAALMGERFLLQAEQDLENARALIGPRRSYIAANLAHQAAEKALKAAIWLTTGKEPPWKHPLDQLVDLVVVDRSQIPADVDAAIAVLSPIFERTRYPSGNVSDPIPAVLISDASAREAIRASEEVMVWVHKLMETSKS